MPIWQLCANLLIPNCLRSNLSYSPLAALELYVNDYKNADYEIFIYDSYGKQIGNMVMDRLKEVDEVAYVRFASVYRQFKDINTFIDELEKLLVEKKKG